MQDIIPKEVMDRFRDYLFNDRADIMQYFQSCGIGRDEKGNPQIRLGVLDTIPESIQLPTNFEDYTIHITKAGPIVAY